MFKIYKEPIAKCVNKDIEKDVDLFLERKHNGVYLQAERGNINGSILSIRDDGILRVHSHNKIPELKKGFKDIPHILAGVSCGCLKVGKEIVAIGYPNEDRMTFSYEEAHRLGLALLTACANRAMRGKDDV